MESGDTCRGVARPVPRSADAGTRRQRKSPAAQRLNSAARASS